MNTMIIKVTAKPNSGKQEVVRVGNKEYVVKLKEKAKNNKANAELLKLMKTYLKKDVRIISGFKSKSKILEVKKINEPWE